MATNPSFKVWALSLAQAQTAAMDAAAYNRANASEPGRFQIEWGTTPGSQWSIGSQALSPASTSTPASSPTPIASSQRTAISSSPTSTNPTVINNQKNTSWSAPIWASPSWTKTEKVKSATIPTSNTPDGGTQGISTATPQQQLTLLQIRDKIRSENPTMKPIDIMKSAREQFNAQRNVYNPALWAPEAKTWIAPLDADLAKLREEKAQKIKDTYKSYALAQADYQKNAGYYTNFEWTNQTFNSVMTDIQNTLTNSKTWQLSDQEMAIIASKNWVSVDAVKNPLSIYGNLQMTDEGKQALWVKNREQEMADMETNKKRAEEYARLQLERNTQQLNYQIEDAQKQLQRNVDWATASGAWSGAARSSWYEQGIKNMRDDTSTIINRINTNIANMNADTSKYVTRLNEDFTTNMTRAKESLDFDLKNLKFDSGLKLNGLDEKYGKNSKELLKALDAIQEEFGTKSLDSFNKYLTSVKSIQWITMDNINLMEKMNTVSQALANRRYGELTANNGALLQNISLSNIADEVKAGKMDFGKYSDIRNLMISAVTNSLNTRWVTIGQEDLNIITHLIDNGATPAQVIARIGWSGTTQMPWSLGDMRSLWYDSNGNPKANGYAWAKNNNPAGITWNANFANMTPGSLADRLAKKWIKFTQGTERWPWEGGQYVQFATMDDGIEALRTLWEISGEKWQTIGDRLKSFSVEWYTLPVDMKKNFNELSQWEQNELLMLQIQKESPKLYEELKKRWVQSVSPTQQFSPSQIVAFDAYTKSNDIKDLKSQNLTLPMYNAYIAQKNIPEAPNAQWYRLSDYTTRIRNMLPAGQADQPWEQAKIEKLAQQYIADGLTPEQASLKYLWFNIKDSNNAELANSIRLAFQNMKTPPKGYEQKVSDMLNSGKTKEAYNFVNSFMDNDVKDKYGDKAILTQNFESSQSRIDKVVSLIQKNRWKIGAFDWPFTDFIKKFKNEPEYQELKTLMTMTQADIRKYFAGSAVTDTEMSALVDFIGGKTNMQPDNLITQLNTIKNDVKQNYDYQRQVYGLTSSNQSSQTPESVQPSQATDKLRSYIQKVRNQ